MNPNSQSSDPSQPFKTPDPSKLQSGQSKQDVREDLLAQQGEETPVLDDDKKFDPFSDESQLGHPDDIAKRQIGPMNRSGG